MSWRKSCATLSTPDSALRGWVTPRLITSSGQRLRGSWPSLRADSRTRPDESNARPRASGSMGWTVPGRAVREITADEGEIVWRVHLANRKAAWYQFLNAMDLGPKYAKTAPLRNATLTGKERQTLVINPGPRSITGRGVRGKAYQFDTGKFMGKKVALGELRTDEAGRLLVLGGFGKSASYRRQARHHVRQQRRLARRHVGRAGARHRPCRRQRVRGRTGHGCGHAAQLRAGALRSPSRCTTWSTTSSAATRSSPRRRRRAPRSGATSSRFFSGWPTTAG